MWRWHCIAWSCRWWIWCSHWRYRINTWTQSCRIWTSALIRVRCVSGVRCRTVIRLNDHSIRRVRTVACRTREKRNEKFIFQTLTRYFSKHNIFRYYLLWYKKRSINNSKVTTWISKVVNVMRRTATVRGWFTAVWCRSERQAYAKAHRSGTTEVNWLGLGRSREKSVCSMIVRALVLIAVRTIGWSTV